MVVGTRPTERRPQDIWTRVFQQAGVLGPSGWSSYACGAPAIKWPEPPGGIKRGNDWVTNPVIEKQPNFQYTKYLTGANRFWANYRAF